MSNFDLYDDLDSISEPDDDDLEDDERRDDYAPYNDRFEWSEYFDDGFVRGGLL